MIWAIDFRDVEKHLSSLGFKEAFATEDNIGFLNGDRLFVILRPNMWGRIPEIYVDRAFDAAGLTVPRWNMVWCD